MENIIGDFYHSVDWDTEKGSFEFESKLYAGSGSFWFIYADKSDLGDWNNPPVRDVRVTAITFEEFEASKYDENEEEIELSNQELTALMLEVKARLFEELGS